MAITRKSAYVETSILSFLCADPLTVPATLEKQRDTALWWNLQRDTFDVWISNQVIIEISRGKPEFVRRRLAKASELKLIEDVAQDRELAAELLVQRLIPPSALVDATHLAIAIRTKMDFLLTWNLRHLANPKVLPLVYNYLSQSGRHVPVITTPLALMESL